MMSALCALILSTSLFAAADESRKAEYQIPDEAAKEQIKGRAVDAVVISIWVFGGAILTFTAVLCFGIGFVMMRSGKDLSDPNYQRLFCMVVLLGLGTFLVVAGYSAVQMNGMFGIMGAIIGYFFSQRIRNKTTDAPSSQSSSAT